MDELRALGEAHAVASDRLATVATAAAVGAFARTVADVEARHADLMRAEIMARELLIDAVWAGYRDDAQARARAVAGKVLVVTFTDADRHALAGFPIQGHPAAAVAAHLRMLVGYALDGADGQAAVADEVRKHGERVGTAVREAYFAGVKASAVAIGRALTGG